MKKRKLMLVGGGLGTGKTTLLLFPQRPCDTNAHR
jgi:Flp pilus assembly CpaF family ATPase